MGREPTRKPKRIATRYFIGAVAIALVVTVIASAVRPWALRDGSPDDRVLATMEQLAWDAQTALDETGELPSSLEHLLSASRWDLMRGSDIGVSYDRLDASSIRLCGEFEKRSSGQATARPFFDVIVGLRPELAGPRPSAGRHCYDIALAQTEAAAREDALLFRHMHAAAIAAECAFQDRGRLSATLQEAVASMESPRGGPLSGGPACAALDLEDRTLESIEYAPMTEPVIRLCAQFHRSFDSSSGPMRIFDPRSDSRFMELAQARPEAGRRCYDIRLLLPDPRGDISMASWDEPVDVGTLPRGLRDAATQDKRAIGDVVNVLRLARCSFTIGGAPPSTFEEAVETVGRRPRVAERYRCEWAPSYFDNPRNAPVASYEPVDAAHVRVCAQFRAAWERPLALDYYSEALANWPTSLPQLQRPISEPGRHCYTVRLTAIGSGVI